MAKNKNKPKREMRKKKQERKQTQMTLDTTTKPLYSCHKGNSVVYYNDDTGTGLVIGGWKNGAVYDTNTFVIDLTGDEDRYGNIPKAYGKTAEKLMANVANSHAGWLSLPFPDYQTPKNMNTYTQWYGMAMDIKEIVDSGKNVLVACLGGHGRSGLFCAIVGYILNHGTEDWSSPVDKIRGIHCIEAIETDDQEQFVYDILGLDLKANPMDYFIGGYDDNWKPVGSFKKCPKCGTDSMYIHSNGMCLSCQDKCKKEQAPIMDITTEMLAGVKCTCENKNCLGTWLAEKCGHAVHDKIIVDGFCEKCLKEQADAEKTLKKAEVDPVLQKCDLCDMKSASAFWTGLCISCELSFESVPDVHDTLTDGYPVLAHDGCEDINTCKGILKADVCRHIVHNRYVVDGLCPQCYNKREMRKMKKMTDTEAK